MARRPVPPGSRPRGCPRPLRRGWLRRNRLLEPPAPPWWARRGSSVGSRQDHGAELDQLAGKESENFKGKDRDPLHNLAGVRTVISKGAVHAEIPIARLSDGQFSYAREQWSWKTPKVTVTEALQGFVLEQQVRNQVFHVVFRLFAGHRREGASLGTEPFQRCLQQRWRVSEVRFPQVLNRGRQVNEPSSRSVAEHAESACHDEATFRGHAAR